MRPCRRDSVREMTYRQWLASIALGVLGALVFLEINDSPFLPAVHADSVQYMEAGRSLAEGNGLTVPITSWAQVDSVGILAHFPPGMSVAIGSVMKTTGVRAHVGALWVLCLSAGISLGVAFLLGFHFGGWLAGFLAVGLIAVSPPFVLAHTAVWSEPLYVSCLLGTLFLMVRNPDRPWLIGIAAVGTVMTRYMGVATVAAVGIWTFFNTRSLKKSLSSVVPGTVAFLGWSFWTHGEGGVVRTAGEYSVELLRTVSQVPSALQFWLAPGLPIVAAILILAVVLLAISRAPKALVQPTGLLVLMHLTVIVLSRVVVDQRIPFDERMLMPVFVLLTVPIAVAVTSVRWRNVALSVAVAWITFAGAEDLQGVKSLQTNGSFYSSAAWITSDLMYWVDNRSSEYQLYSNEPGIMYFLASRHAKTLPLKSHDFDAFVALWLESPGAIIVTAPMRQDEVPPETYLARLPVEVVHLDEMGIVMVPRGQMGGGTKAGGSSDVS